jgi:hypothetical protein
MATPLFILNDFIDLAGDLKVAAPDVRKFYLNNMSAAVATDSAIAASALTKAGVVGGSNLFMAKTYGVLAAAARTANKMMIQPILPFLPLIATISAAIYLTYLAFKHNFLGIKDLLVGFINGIKTVALTFGQVVGDKILSVLKLLEREVKAIARTIKFVIFTILEPFSRLIYFLSGGRLKNKGGLYSTINLLLFPLTILAGVLRILIHLISIFTQVAIILGGTLINTLLLPLRIVIEAFMGTVQGIQFLLYQAASFVDRLLYRPMIWLTQAGQIGAKVYAVFFKIVVDTARLLQPILKLVGAIAGISGLLAIAANFTVISAAITGFISSLSFLSFIVVPMFGFITTALSAVGTTLMFIGGWISAIIGGIITFVANFSIPVLLTGLSSAFAFFAPFLLMAAAIIAVFLFLKVNFHLLVALFKGVVFPVVGLFIDVIVAAFNIIWITVSVVARTIAFLVKLIFDLVIGFAMLAGGVLLFFKISAAIASISAAIGGIISVLPVMITVFSFIAAVISTIVSGGLATLIATMTAAIAGFVFAAAPIVAIVGGLLIVAVILRGLFSFIGKIIWEILIGTFSIFKNLFGSIWNEISSIGKLIGDMWQMVVSPFKILFQQLTGSKQEIDIIGGFAKGVAQIILIAVRSIAVVIFSIVWAISMIIKALLVVGGIVSFVILSPFLLILWVITQIKLAIQGIVNFFAQLPAQLSSLAVNIPIIGRFFKPESAPLPGYRSGGLISGQGTSTGDRTVIAASPGEYMVNAQSTRNNFGLLEAINASKDYVLDTFLTPAPAPVFSLPAGYGGESFLGGKEPPEMTVNISFGNVVLSGTNETEVAESFFEMLESPQAARRIRDILRSMVERMK